MKYFMPLIVLLLNMVTAISYAQGTEQLTQSRQLAQEQKRSIVLENLQLSKAEEAAFIPVYEQYQNARRLNNEALGRLIVVFSENYDVMTDEKALKLLQDVLAIKQGRMDIKLGYLGQFKAVLPGKKVARYYQIESKLEALAEVKLAEIIPLLK